MADRCHWTGKIMFRNACAAGRIKKRMRKEDRLNGGGVPGKKLKCFLCEHCRCWHLGNVNVEEQVG